MATSERMGDGGDTVPRSRWEAAEAEVAALRAEMKKRDDRAVYVVCAMRAALVEIANYSGDPNTPVKNSVKKSAIARRVLAQLDSNP